MSAILPPKKSPRRPLGSPLPTKLAIPAKDASATKPLSLPTLPAKCVAQQSPSPTRHLTINASMTSQNLSTPAPSYPTITASSSLYPTTVMWYDPDSENGGRIEDQDRIIDDIHKAIGSLGVSERSSRSRSASTYSQRNRTGSLTNDKHCTSGPSSLTAGDQGETQFVVEEEVNMDPAELEDMKTLGEGAGGEVKQVLHKPSRVMMAKKTIPTSPNPSIHKQILRELAFNRTVSDGRCSSLVKYYGAFLEQQNTQIAIIMELCEGGSLDAIYRRIKARGGRIGEKIISRVALSVLEGLTYLHQHKIIHRDIKPSNILVTKDGRFKLCDLGVSGELIASLAGSFMGTSFYMAPERIRGGEKYTIRADVWSLGLSLLEIILNRFPLGTDGAQLQPFELLQTIITFEVPSLTDEEAQGVKWTNGLRNFIGVCLEKDPSVRPYPKALLDHAWIVKSQTWPTDTAAWVRGVWGW